MSIRFSSVPTATNGTAITSVTPEVGSSFSFAGTPLATATVQSNELYTVPASSFDVAYMTCNAVSAVGNRQKISATIRFGSSAADSFHALMVNYSGPSVFYKMEFNQYAGPGLILFRVNGAQTGLASYPFTPSNNTSYTWALENDGHGILKATLNGVVVFVFDDSAANLTGGSPGYKFEQFGTSVPQAFHSNIVVNDAPVLGLVQKIAADTNTDPQSKPFTFPVTSGSAIVVGVRDSGGSGTSTATVTDSLSNSYSFVDKVQSGGGTVLVYAARSATSGICTASVDTSADVATRFVMAEYAGTFGSTLWDSVSSKASANNTTAQAGSITPTVSNAILLSFVGTAADNTPTIDSGYTVNSIGAARISDAYKIVSSSAASNPTWTFSGGEFQDYGAINLVLIENAGGSPPVGPSAATKARYRAQQLQMSI